MPCGLAARGATFGAALPSAFLFTPWARGRHHPPFAIASAHFIASKYRASRALFTVAMCRRSRRRGTVRVPRVRLLGRVLRHREVRFCLLCAARQLVARHCVRPLARRTARLSAALRERRDGRRRLCGPLQVGTVPASPLLVAACRAASTAVGAGAHDTQRLTCSQRALRAHQPGARRVGRGLPTARLHGPARRLRY